MQGITQLDSDAGFGALAPANVAPAAPAAPAETTPQGVEGPGSAAQAGLDEDAGFAPQVQAEPDELPPDDEDWRGLHGGRINSKEEALALIGKLDRTRVHTQKERDEVRKEVAELRAQLKDLTANAMKIATSQRPATAPSTQPQPQRPIITKRQVEEAFAKGDMDTFDAYLNQQAGAQARMMASHLTRQMRAELDPLKRALEEKGRAIDEVVSTREDAVWDFAKNEANSYLESKLPEGTPPEVKDAIYERIEQLGSNDDAIIKFMELTPAGQLKGVNLKALVNMALGEFAEMLYGQGAPAARGAQMPAARRAAKTVLTSTLAPSKRPPMPSETRMTKAEKEDADQRQRLIANPSRRW